MKKTKQTKLEPILSSFGSRARVPKAAYLSIALSTLVAIAGVAMVVLVQRLLAGSVGGRLAAVTSLLCLTVIIWGAASSIGSALDSLQTVRRAQEIERAYGELDALNREMRAQRHDFLNHLQVVYSLIEMNEPDEALRYMDKIYGDMQRVSRMLRTACPAVNALIQAKSVEAQQRGVELRLSIAAKWDDALMPAWEICRALANLLDNALDAVCARTLPAGEKPSVELVLGEDLRSWFFCVRNNGPAIPPDVLSKMFEPGFTTKTSGQGMGLYIVRRTVEALGGQVSAESREGDTVFTCFVPRQRLKLGDTLGREA